MAGILPATLRAHSLRSCVQNRFLRFCEPRFGSNPHPRPRNKKSAPPAGEGTDLSYSGPGRGERISWRASCPPPCGRTHFARACKIASCDFVNLDSVPIPTHDPETKNRLPLRVREPIFLILDLVGVRGFEPPAPASRNRISGCM